VTHLPELRLREVLIMDRRAFPAICEDRNS
jgi:hypothetical protein